MKEILKEMKNVSSLMIDLAYFSLMFGDRDIVNEVYRLEEKMDELEAQLIIHATLATRGRMDAEKIVSVYYLAKSMDYISDTMADVARIVERGGKLRYSKEFFLNSATDVMYAIHVKENNPFIGKRISETYDVAEGVFDVVAIRRDKNLIFNPPPDFIVNKGDTLYIKGFINVIEKVVELSGGKLEEYVGEETLLDTLLQLKNTSEFMIDLAYSAILLNSTTLAEEVFRMEEYIDRLTEEFRNMVSQARDLSVEEEICMLGLADAFEELADAAVDMLYNFKAGLEPHPVIAYVLDETSERVGVIKVTAKLKGKSIADLDLHERGLTVLAVRRGLDYFISPPSRFTLNENDVLIVNYYSEAEEFVKELMSDQ